MSDYENISTETLELATATALGDLTVALVDEIKALPNVWPKLNEYEQLCVINRAKSSCTELIKKLVNLIAADGRETITADLEQITAKDGIKALLKLTRFDKHRHALLDAVGKPLLLIVADHEQFLGGEEPTPDPDQRELPVADVLHINQRKRSHWEVITGWQSSDGLILKMLQTCRLQLESHFAGSLINIWPAFLCVRLPRPWLVIAKRSQKLKSFSVILPHHWNQYSLLILGNTLDGVQKTAQAIHVQTVRKLSYRIYGTLLGREVIQRFQIPA